MQINQFIKFIFLSSDKKRYSYIWQIEKVEIEGEFKRLLDDY